MNKEMEILKAFGCKGIKYENLINNYFIRFSYKNNDYTIEHVLNVYGASVDLWELFGPPSKTFNTLEELLEYIK